MDRCGSSSDTKTGNVIFHQIPLDERGVQWINAIPKTKQHSIKICTFAPFILFPVIIKKVVSIIKVNKSHQHSMAAIH